MHRLWICSLLLLVAALAGRPAAGQPADEPRGTARGEAATEAFRDDPLGHVRPGVGAGIQTAIEENLTEEDHQGLLGQRLHGRGPVAFEYLYTAELLSNTRGGITTHNATQYEGLLDLAMRIDLDKARSVLPGKVFVLFQETHGRGLSTDFVGDAQILSGIDSFNNIAQVSEYWWETPLGECLTLRLGKQYVNGEFHVTELASDFVHAAYGIPPTLPAPTYPNASIGAVLLASLSDSLVAKAGIWDGQPHGGNWGWSGTGITYTNVELERRHKLGGVLPGVIDVGFAHLSPVDMDPSNYLPEERFIYTDIEQTLYREDPTDEKNDQGLAAFGRYGTVFPKEGVPYRSYFCVGRGYKGLIGNRDEDLIGVGLNHLQHNLGGTCRETATEVFYKAHITPWMTLQPDVQFISSTSGIYRDALVAGVRYQVVF